MTKFIITLLSLFYCCYCFSQEQPRFNFGILDTTVVSVEEFNNQKELIIEKGFKIDTATAYFSGANFPLIRLVRIYPNFDSLTFSKFRDSIVPGSVVSFDVISSKISTNKHFRTTLSFVFYSLKKIDNYFSESSTRTEWKRLRELKYIKGTIYFSGSFFPNVVTISINSENLPQLKKQFDRCGPGSSITFENVYYHTDENKIDKLNMTFKME